MPDYVFVVCPLFFNFELPVTHLMVTLSIMQPIPAPDNTDIHWTTDSRDKIVVTSKKQLRTIRTDPLVFPPLTRWTSGYLSKPLGSGEGCEPTLALDECPIQGKGAVGIIRAT